MDVLSIVGFREIQEKVVLSPSKNNNSYTNFLPTLLNLALQYSSEILVEIVYSREISVP
jgi:hypothetical protein